MEFMERPSPDSVHVVEMEFLAIVTTGESFGEYAGIRFKGVPIGNPGQLVQGTLILPLDGLYGMRETIDEMLVSYEARAN